MQHIVKGEQPGKQCKINVTNGQQNESIALEAFKQIYIKGVLNCGLIVDVKLP